MKRQLNNLKALKPLLDKSFDRVVEEAESVLKELDEAHKEIRALQVALVVRDASVEEYDCGIGKIWVESDNLRLKGIIEDFILNKMTL